MFINVELILLKMYLCHLRLLVMLTYEVQMLNSLLKYNSCLIIAFVDKYGKYV